MFDVVGVYQVLHNVNPLRGTNILLDRIRVVNARL